MTNFKTIIISDCWRGSVLLALISLAITETQILEAESINKRTNESISQDYPSFQTSIPPTITGNHTTVKSTKLDQDDLKKPNNKTIGSKSKEQYSRLTYNISFANGSFIHEYQNQTNDEDLDVSDSRPRTRLSREDDDLTFDTATEDEGPTGYGISSDSDHPEEAGSSLSERRLIKEVTRELSKIIGKSASGGSSDIEMLDKWRAKQKGLHDGKTKLITDLISGIVEHKKTDKELRQIDNQSGSRKRSKLNDLSGHSTLGSYSGSLDPELANDAETVVQHVQSLASILEGTNHGELSGIQGDDNSDYASDTKNSDQDIKRDVFTGGPILRQFKKIKSQISHRRRQLDQIKKMFNVDLALNNTAQQGGHRQKKNQDISDLLVLDDSTSGSKKKNGELSERKLAKVQELMNYLRENPEVLTSVISELNNEAGEPYLQSKITPHDEQDTYDSPPASYSGSYNPETERKISSYRRQNAHGDGNRWIRGGRWKLIRARESEADESAYRPGGRYSYDRSDYYRRSRRGNPDLNQNDGYNQRSIYNSDSQSPSHSSSRVLAPPTPIDEAPKTTKSPETRLLESLREKQVQNLARLDQVIAERQTSNRSHPNVGPGQSNKLAESQRQAIKHQGVNASRDPSDEEIVHHFMVMNGQNAGLTDSKHLSADMSILDDQDWYNGVNPNKQTLPRFSAWRDVSQSEASSSQRNQRADLHPLGINSQPQDRKSMVSPWENNRNLDSNIDSTNTYQSSNSQPRLAQTFGFQFPNNEDYGDSFITKPGLPRGHPDITQQSNSMFMTRSSVTDGEPSSETSERRSVVNQSGGLLKDDDDIDAEDTPIKRKPVDYFSAYKRPSNEPREPVNVSGPQKVAKTRFQKDADGSMWAR